MTARGFAVLAALTLACVPGRAQASQPKSQPESDWQPLEPAKVGETGGGFGEPERVQAIERLRAHVLDQLCRNVDLKADYDFGLGEYGGIGGGMKRHLAQMPDGALSVVDEELLHLSVGRAFPIVDGTTGLGGSLWLGGRVDGSSMVIRPLHERSTCKELPRLLNVRDIKTVLPLKASRLSEMMVGELWRVPLRVTVGHSESVGKIVEQAADGAGLGVSISFASEETGATTMTLFRVSESQLRMRYRVDRVEVRTKGAQVVYSYPAAEFGAMGLGVLGKLVGNAVAGELRKYAMLSMGWSSSRNDGKRVLLEYIVDPRDPEQMDAAVKALKGDFADLVKAGYRVAAQKATDESTREYYRKMQKDHDAALGPSAYAAMSEYEGRSKSIRLNLGLFGGAWTKTRDSDRMTRLNGSLEQFLMSHAGRFASSDLFNLPFVGPLVKTDRRQEVYAVTRALPGEAHGPPMAVFMQQHGFLRATPSSVRSTVEEFNAIAALAGAQRPGTARNMKLPVDRFTVPEPKLSQYPGRGGSETESEPANQKGLVSFTLVFTQKAVRDILSAPPETAQAAFAAIAAEKLEPSLLAKATAEFVKQLKEARETVDNEQRAAALTRLMAGGGKLQLVYGDVAKVLVQLVDPLDLQGEFFSHVDRPKDEGPAINLRLSLRKDRKEDELLKSASAAKNRFATPSILLD